MKVLIIAAEILEMRKTKLGAQAGRLHDRETYLRQTSEETNWRDTLHGEEAGPGEV